MTQSRNRLAQLVRLAFYLAPFEKLLRRLTLRMRSDSLVARIPPKHIDYPKPSWRLTKSGGITLRLDLSDLVGWYAYWGFSEPARQRLYSLIQKGDVVFDIGANIGEVALNAAEKVGAKGNVVAFEPFPTNFDALQKNAQLNDLPNLTIVNKAVGAEKAILKMIVADDANAGMNRITDGSDGDDDAAEVEVVTLDDFIDPSVFSKIDLIKIDVEGFEMHVLRGAVSTLTSFRPKLFVELIDTYLQRQGSSTKEVLQLLESFGYELSFAETGEPIRSDSDFTNSQFDVVAFPRARSAA